MNINKRGYLMGIRETPRGTFTAVQGQHWYEFDMMGQILADHKLPRGFLDASHESIETVKRHRTAARRQTRLPQRRRHTCSYDS